jgi:hypothetical protein
MDRSRAGVVSVQQQAVALLHQPMALIGVCGGGGGRRGLCNAKCSAVCVLAIAGDWFLTRP